MLMGFLVEPHTLSYNCSKTVSLSLVVTVIVEVLLMDGYYFWGTDAVILKGLVVCLYFYAFV